MLSKEILKKTIENLPSRFSIDELIERLIFIEKVEEGIAQADTGEVVSNEEVMEMIAKWSK